MRLFSRRLTVTNYNKTHQVSLMSAGVRKARGKSPNLLQTELYDRITRLQVDILERIQKLKASPKSSTCEHLQMTSDDCPPYDSSVNYYDMFWRRWLLNEICKGHLDQVKRQTFKFKRRMDRIEGLFDQWQQHSLPLNRLNRPKNPPLSMVKERCSYCEKSYPDKEALAIHVKYKQESSNSSQSGRIHLVSSVHSEEPIFQEQE